MKPFLIALLLLAPLTRAADLQLDGTLTSTHVKNADGKLSERYELTAALINTSDKPVTVITERLDFRGNAHGLAVGLIHDFKIDAHQVIPSLPTLAPVTLQPGEAAALVIDAHALDGYKGGELKMEYAVTKTWGERLGI